MTLGDEIAALQVRIARASADGDAWRASGRQEKYLEAVCTAEALELQVELLRREELRASKKASARAPVCALLGGGPPKGIER
jgi:hypothetical protein